MNMTQDIIQAVRRAWIEAKYRAGVQRARAKTTQERAISEMELILDDMKAEGHDLNTPLGREIFTQIIASRLPQGDRPPRSETWDSFRDHGKLEDF
jgi:hypothetical protein